MDIQVAFDEIKTLYLSLDVADSKAVSIEHKAELKAQREILGILERKLRYQEKLYFDKMAKDMGRE